MTQIVATPNTDDGTIEVSVIDIPVGFDTATVYRTLAGVRTTLVTNTSVVDGRVQVTDHAAPPGWSVTYSATLRSSAGVNLAENPGLEADSTTGWFSGGLARELREDGSAHGGARYFRGTATPAASTLVPANVSAITPGYVSAADFIPRH